MNPDLSLDAPTDSLPGNVYPSYWIYLNRFHPIDTLRTLPELHLLFIHSTRSYERTMVDHWAWQKAMEGNNKASFVLLDGLNHRFTKGYTRPTLTEYNDKANVHVSLIETVETWIKNIPE